MKMLAIAALALAACVAGPRPSHPRVENALIGFGCAPGDRTLLAAEEDEFPSTCDAIEPTAGAVCAIGGERLEPIACRDFWGDGY